jgi:transposase InsO family protein
VHHSDRGLQYASEEYAKVLDNNRVIPSMSRPANPYDNASCESFMKSLKREEIYANIRLPSSQLVRGECNIATCPLRMLFT